MQILIYILIAVLGSFAYINGIHKMIQGKYKPNTFSRVIWLFLAINGFAGVLLGGGSVGSIVMAGVMLVGNLAIAIVSLKKGFWEFGQLEKICVALLVASGVIWVVYDAPLINLSIGLFAHFIGALPTYRRVINRPSSEDVTFWFIFSISSGLGVFVDGWVGLAAIILPLYYTAFDLSILFLALRPDRQPDLIAEAR